MKRNRGFILLIIQICISRQSSVAFNTICLLSRKITILCQRPDALTTLYESGMIHCKERTLVGKNILYSLASHLHSLALHCQPRFHSLAARFTTTRRLPNTSQLLLFHKFTASHSQLITLSSNVSRGVIRLVA